MGLGLHRGRRLAGAIALVGMAFYAVLIPWHTVSQAAAQLPHPSDKLSQPNCHSSGPQGSKGSLPAKPLSQCPICKGFAALQFALSGTTSLAFIPSAITDFTTQSAEDSLSARLIQAPQNRGPPL
jgi:hypothetical protein